MEFCSKYGYDYGFEGSEEEDISDEEGETNQKVTKRYRKADSNIMAVKFDQLVVSNEMFAGEPIACTKCSAFMSSISKKNIEIKKDNKYTWTCEFCSEQNEVVLFNSSFDQIPNVDDVTYLLEAAPELNEEKNTTKSNSDTSSDEYFTFCIDISGSMDEIISVGRRNEDTNVAISRLDRVKHACIENLSNLKKDEPNKRVCLVTFSDHVKFYGDATKATINKPILDTFVYQDEVHSTLKKKTIKNKSILNSFKNFLKFKSSTNTASDLSETEEDFPIEEKTDILENKEKMFALAALQSGELEGIAKTHLKLENLIKNLRTEGSTALGPGLVFALGFTSKKAGSQIVLCTDGAANVGMGSTSRSYDNDNAEKFYNYLAEEAKAKSVTVNVISMEGTDCKLGLLGRVADKSNGTLNIVNPCNLNEQFQSILKNRIVATNVKAKLIVNYKYLYVRDDEFDVAESKAIESNDLSKKEALNELKKSFSIKDIGNANLDTEITFEYGVRKLKEKVTGGIGEVPFQLQITYTNTEGAKAVRVYTKQQMFSSDRSQVEQNLLEKDIIWSNAAQKISNHLLTSNVVTSKYKERQIRNLKNTNKNFQKAPAEYEVRGQMINSLAKSANIRDFSDTKAQVMYSGHKIARSKFKSNRSRSSSSSSSSSSG